MNKVPSHLQLLMRSICHKQDGLVTDFDIITKQISKIDFISCELENRTHLSIAFSVLYEKESYLVVFSLFPETALSKENIDITITRK